LHPSSFVDAQNDSRRHITKSQRAAVAVAMHGYIRPGNPNYTPGVYLSKTVPEMAVEAGVGTSTIKDAIAADKAGLIDDVRTGKAAAKARARRQQLGEEAEGIAFSIKVEALRKLGEMLKAAPKNKGAKGSAVTNRYRAQVKDETPTLSDLGIDKRTSAIAQKLRSGPVAR